LLVSQFSVTGALYACRPDLVGFVNSLPWVVIEFKKTGVPARAASDENLTHYKQQIPVLFWSNALLIASNGTDSRAPIPPQDLRPEMLGGVRACVRELPGAECGCLCLSGLSMIMMMCTERRMASTACSAGSAS